jgi:toxin HigB-1
MRVPNEMNGIRTRGCLVNRARKPSDMDLPGFGLHPLKGNLKDFWSVTVRANWRIIFRFEAGEVHDVDLLDYH